MTTAVGSYATTSAFKAYAGITTSANDTIIGLLCDRVNQYMESFMRQSVAPIGSTTYLYDGNGLTHIFLPLPVDETLLGVGGLRAVTLVEVASQTGGDFSTLDAGDYYLRQRFGVAGPYRWLVISDQPSGSFHTWPKGRSNIRVTGTAGWTAIPDDLTEVALNLVQRAWNARESGQENITRMDPMGAPYIANLVSGRDRDVMRFYKLRAPV